MKKTFLILSILLVSITLWPLGVLAHGRTSSNSGESRAMPQNRFNMMRVVEDKALGDDVHEEMETLMQKMMSGNLSKEETNRLVELMNQYPGPNAMMMNRMMMGSQREEQHLCGMDMLAVPGISGIFGIGALLFILFHLVWGLVGILAVIWLWKKLSK